MDLKLLDFIPIPALNKTEFTIIIEYLGLHWFLAASNSSTVVFTTVKCSCINNQTFENSYHKMYQFQSSIHPLNSNAPMHAPVNLSSPLVKWLLSLVLSFLTAASLPHSQLWITFIKEKPQSFKIIHWAILINPKVIWKLKMTRTCWAVDIVYYSEYTT